MSLTTTTPAVRTGRGRAPGWDRAGPEWWPAPPARPSWAYLVLVLVACGAVEVLRQRAPCPAAPAGGTSGSPLAVIAPGAVAAGGFGALAWTALKVGALSFGGGFVIIPLMQGDAVHVNHWMTNAQFLNAVALGQITPGPVVATVAAVGYAAHDIAGVVSTLVGAAVVGVAAALLGAPVP